MAMKVYKDSNYKGKMLRINGNIASLKKKKFSDIISSLKVEPYSKTKMFEAYFLFQHSSYKGYIWGPFLSGDEVPDPGSDFRDNEVTSVYKISASTYETFEKRLEDKLIEYAETGRMEEDLGKQRRSRTLRSIFSSIIGGDLEGAQEKVEEEVKETVENVVEEGQEAVQTVVEEGKETIEETVENVVETVPEAVQTVVEEGKETIEETIENVVETGKEAVEDIIEGGLDITEVVGDIIDEIIEERTKKLKTFLIIACCVGGVLIIGGIILLIWLISKRGDIKEEIEGVQEDIEQGQIEQFNKNLEQQQLMRKAMQESSKTSKELKKMGQPTGEEIGQEIGGVFGGMARGARPGKDELETWLGATETGQEVASALVTAGYGDTIEDIAGKLAQGNNNVVIQARSRDPGTGESPPGSGSQ